MKIVSQAKARRIFFRVLRDFKGIFAVNLNDWNHTMLTRHTTEPVYHPTQILNLSVSILALLLAVYASVFSWQSWQDEKAALLYNLQNIMTLEERAVDTYFTQL